MLNRSEPYAEVHGLPGIMFEQNSLYFDAAGNSAVPKAIVEEAEPVDDGSPLPYNYLTEQPTSHPGIHEQGDALQSMHWRHLKALVESYGGEWDTRDKALEFLRGKK